jgi:hypothetical protein
VAFRVCEVGHHELGPWSSLRTHGAGPAEALGPPERDADVRDPDVEDDVRIIVRAAADTAGDADPLAGVDEAVVAILGDRARDRTARADPPQLSRRVPGRARA